ncbi:MAG: hypothetical protein FWE14_11120 [Lachnospiraceae bacterium]|nr:hypothetical protein [Lachnospiraceae bacterium]
MKKAFFEGWYYKQQANGKTLAIIPGRANDSAFIHIITDDFSHSISFPLKKYTLFRRKVHKKFVLRVGGNYFSQSGLKLKINRDDISISGYLEFHGLTPIKGDIMGPFRFFPMECRHGVISMKHEVSGVIKLNGETFNFDNGTGYIETDSGYSFPAGYSWIHSNDFKADCSIMAAVAKIPFFGFNFTGCICVVWLNGKEYRLATYLGVKIIRCEPSLIELKQGKYHLVIAIKQNQAFQLPAPRAGVMSRLIKESPSCPAVFVFKKDGKVIFSAESMHTSYECMLKSN